MHTRLLTLIVVFAAAASGAAEPTAPPDVNAIDAAAPFIAKANKEWEAAIQTGDADALSRPYHEDGVFVGPDGNAVRGRAAIRAMYAGRAASKTRIVTATIQSDGRVEIGRASCRERV